MYCNGKTTIYAGKDTWISDIWSFQFMVVPENVKNQTEVLCTDKQHYQALVNLEIWLCILLLINSFLAASLRRKYDEILWLRKKPLLFCWLEGSLGLLKETAANGLLLMDLISSFWKLNRSLKENKRKHSYMCMISKSIRKTRRGTHRLPWSWPWKTLVWFLIKYIVLHYILRITEV